jgi:GDPmannose 4,6-dehydratase
MMSVKKAFVLGITGQDGSYLAELLLSKGYEVHGLIRRASSFNTGRLRAICPEDNGDGESLFLHFGDLSDASQISKIISSQEPDEVYNLAAQSHVRVSFETPEYTGDVDALGTTRILEAIKRDHPAAKFYQASSSEMFGSGPAPQNENTIFQPRSPYACAKLFSYWMTRNYREGYGLFACNGILFNHESPRRGETFVTRKVTRSIAAILAGKQERLHLGNLAATRDWGFAPEYVEGMWKMLQADKPSDYVIGTGETNSVEAFVEDAFAYAGLEREQKVVIDKQLFRPTEVDHLRADSSKAKRVLGWEPRIKYLDLVHIMVDADMRAAGLEPPGEGDKAIRRAFPKKWWQGD